MSEEEKKIDVGAVRDSIIDLYRRGYGQKFYASPEAVRALNGGSPVFVGSLFYDRPTSEVPNLKVRLEVHADTGLVGQQVAI